jgi:hypothetical protein
LTWGVEIGDQIALQATEGALRVSVRVCAGVRVRLLAGREIVLRRREVSRLRAMKVRRAGKEGVRHEKQ